MKVKIVGRGMDREVILTTKSGFSYRITQGNDNGIHILPGDYHNGNIHGYIHGQKSSKDGKEFDDITTISLYGRQMPSVTKEPERK